MGMVSLPAISPTYSVCSLYVADSFNIGHTIKSPPLQAGGLFFSSDRWQSRKNSGCAAHREFDGCPFLPIDIDFDERGDAHNIDAIFFEVCACNRNGFDRAGRRVLDERRPALVMFKNFCIFEKRLDFSRNSCYAVIAVLSTFYSMEGSICVHE